MSLQKRFSMSLALSVIACSVFPQLALAESTTKYELRPHCTQGDDANYNAVATQCPTFAVRDPLSLTTPSLGIGEEMAVDIVIHNPEKQPIQRFRVWVSYDPTVLQGTSLSINEAFPTPTPGEEAFVETEGTVKLSGTTTTPIADEWIRVAQIHFTVKETNVHGTPLAPFDSDKTPEPETGIFTSNGTQETNIAAPSTGYVFVSINNNTTSASSVASVASASGSLSSLASSATTQSSVTSSLVSSLSSLSSLSSASSSSSSSETVFPLLQVQNVRITTEGSAVFLAWDVLPSTELIAYNIYYGTVSGQYIQRRTIEKNASSLTIRALPIGSTYYFAIRGMNAQNQETEFSQEVGISVGNPSTSTSPLTANTLPTETPDTGGTISGETGTASSLVIFVLFVAVIGTIFAFRRQLHTHVPYHD